MNDSLQHNNNDNRAHLHGNKVRTEYSLLSILNSWDSSSKAIISRITFLIIAVFGCFSIVSYKIIAVALSTNIQTKHFSKNDYFRREIVDRNGVLLAINLPSSSAFANPQKMIDINDAVEKLSKNITGIDKKKLLHELKNNKSFAWIKRDLTPKEQKIIHDLAIPGIYFEEEQKRVYTQGKSLSHLIGYVGRDNDGLAGIEKSYDEFLTSKNIYDNDPSQPLKLTIDARVQDIVNEELNNAMEKFRAVAGIALVIDPNNGEVIAAVSKPDFNPHYPSKASSDELFNRYSLGVYELGSIMKTITMAIGFDTQKISLFDAYDVTSMRIAKFNVKDYHKASGWHSVAEIFLHSSNIGMSQIILEVGKEDFLRYIEKLGLTEKLAIEIPEKAAPIIPKISNWTDLSMATMSYGYGMSVSPLHFMNAAIPIVNGGTMYPIHFVKHNEEVKGTKVLQESTSDNMHKLLRLVVSQGTGRKAEIKGYFIGAKTGTANKREGRKYVENKRTSSFFAVVPSVKPKYAVFLMLDEPKPTKETFGFATAGWTAVPVTKNIISRIVTLYGISPLNEDKDSQIEEELHVEYKIDEEA